MLHESVNNNFRVNSPQNVNNFLVGIKNVIHF